MDKFVALQMLKLRNSLMKDEKDKYVDFLFFFRKKKKEVKRK